jgi:hypothetical protein
MYCSVKLGTGIYFGKYTLILLGEENIIGCCPLGEICKERERGEKIGNVKDKRQKAKEKRKIEVKIVKLIQKRQK